MTGHDLWRARYAAMVVRVCTLALVVFLPALASFVSGSVGEAQAQQQPAGKVYRIGFLRSGHSPESYIAGLQQGLREQGYVPGQNVVVEVRATDGSADQLPGLAEWRRLDPASKANSADPTTVRTFLPASPAESMRPGLPPAGTWSSLARRTLPFSRHP